MLVARQESFCPKVTLHDILDGPVFSVRQALGEKDSSYVQFMSNGSELFQPKG